MAQKGVQLDPQTLSCSICLELLKVPVTIHCGHSYCMKCITNFWDGENESKIYSCPQCRQIFTPRPVLVKNTLLAALVEPLKKTGSQAADADPCYAEAGDVACDVCSERKLKAFKSCLVCLASYCEKHLQFHYESPTFKKHKLVDPLEKLQENICSRHGDVMKMFCRTDQRCICYLCSVEEHKGHEVVSALVERTEKQRELEESQQNIQQRIRDRERQVRLLQQELEAVNRSADRAVKDSEKIFNELRRIIRKTSTDLKQQLRSQQETEAGHIKELQKQLEEEIADLRAKDAERKLVSCIEDHNQFLHSYPSLSQLSAPTDTSGIVVRPLRYFDEVTAAVSELRDQLQNILMDKSMNISLAVTRADVLLSLPEPKTRAEFLKHSREITMDPNTVHRCLLLSKGNKKAERTSQQQPYSSHPDRFTVWYQVLSVERLMGRCYWEVVVERKGRRVDVAVAYKDITRAGRSDECGFGCSDKSWVLRCDAGGYTFWSSNRSTPVRGPQSSRIGVYLDHGAGILSFYSVSRAMTLLHRVQTTFTQPLYAGVWLCSGGTAEFCKLK